jgi:hypothetical protein
MLAIDFQSAHSAVSVDFFLSDGEAIPFIFENPTGVEKKSPHGYMHLELGVPCVVIEWPLEPVLRDA